jgi:uncharacterized protein
MHHVIVPGINGSGPGHWQSIWQAEWGPAASRIDPASWDEPDLDDWLGALDRAVDQVPDRSEVVLVAHSLGCLATAAWLTTARPGVRGAFLVAPPDVEGADFPASEAASFVRPWDARLTAAVLVVSSTDDPYCTPEAVRRLAAGWEAGHVEIGAAGHVNTASNLGTWPEGRALLEAFIASAESA